MFVHICRVCSGGNILVASDALMFCILMSLAEIRPLSSKLWGIGPALLLLPSVKIWCICFGRWDSFFFLVWEFYSNEADIDNRLPQTLLGMFLKVAMRITGEKNENDYSHHEHFGDDDGDNGMPQFSGAFERLQGVCLPLRCYFHTIFLLVASSQLCTPYVLLPLLLYRSISLILYFPL